MDFYVLRILRNSRRWLKKDVDALKGWTNIERERTIFFSMVLGSKGARKKGVAQKW